MRTHIKTSAALIFGVALVLNGVGALGQPATSGSTTDKAAQAADFAKKEKAMQDASRSSGGAMMPTPTQATGLNKNKDAGKEAAAAELSLQTHKGSAPVDKNAKAVAPIKNISKMTPEERAELRKEVVKDAKP